MEPVHRFNPNTAPTPLGKYSHLAVTDPTTTIASFAGQVPVAADGSIPEDVSRQTRLVFDAIWALLRSQHATPQDIVKLTTFVVDRDNLPFFNLVRDHVYAEWFPEGDFPPNTLLLVAGLAAPPMRVEIEGTFVVTKDRFARGAR